MEKFADRFDAGRKLAEALRALRLKNPFVLALPRGGVPVGYEIARILQAPLDVVVVRKIGLPAQPEFGIGAIAEGNGKLLDAKTVKHLILTPQAIAEVFEREKHEVKRRVKIYRNNQKLPSLQGKTAIVVDDGLATGVTARTAVAVVKKLHPRIIIFATPVCALDMVQELQQTVDSVLCLVTPSVFFAVGVWYEDYTQVTDEEVIKLLEKSRRVIANSEAKRHADVTHPHQLFHH